MLALPNNMATPIFQEFKKQASFFLREKIKTARLALTDVTPTELLTEDATNENLLSLDTRILGAISKAAFEVDDYERIVEILHKRLLKFDRKNWRPSYNALVLLEHLLTHGPLRVAEEFQYDKQVIKEMTDFQYIDEKGFNWGSSVRRLSERVLRLLGNETILKEERARARELTRGIKGFGSFNHRSSSMDGRSLSSSIQYKYGRCNSHRNLQEGLNKNFFNDQITHKESNHSAPKQLQSRAGGDEDHPFCNNENENTASLLSSMGS